LLAGNLDAEDFAGLTLCPHFKGTATHFAICGELLAGAARIDQELERSSAEWTLNGCACLHLLIPISSTNGFGASPAMIPFGNSPELTELTASCNWFILVERSIRSTLK